jgi:hypothetical protein
VACKQSLDQRGEVERWLGDKGNTQNTNRAKHQSYTDTSGTIAAADRQKEPLGVQVREREPSEYSACECSACATMACGVELDRTGLDLTHHVANLADRVVDRPP